MKESGPPTNPNKSGIQEGPDGTSVGYRTDGTIYARYLPDGTTETYDKYGKLWRRTYPDETAEMFDVETGETTAYLDRAGKPIRVDDNQPNPEETKRLPEPIAIEELTEAERKELAELEARFAEEQAKKARKTMTSPSREKESSHIPKEYGPVQKEKGGVEKMEN